MGVCSANSKWGTYVGNQKGGNAPPPPLNETLSNTLLGCDNDHGCLVEVDNQCKIMSPICVLYYLE